MSQRHSSLIRSTHKRRRNEQTSPRFAATMHRSAVHMLLSNASASRPTARRLERG